MTIKTNEFWTDETFEDIVRKVKIATREVKFGIFNSFPKSFEKYPRKWVGEVNQKKQTFKLFRTTSSDNTSDLSVTGSCTVRGGKNVIVVKHKMHFTVIFGAVGLLVFAIAVFFLLQQKGVVIPVAIQAPVLLLVIMSYAYTVFRDLRLDETEIEKLLSRVLDEKDDSDDEPLMP